MTVQEADIKAFEQLNKWSRCDHDIGAFMVYGQHLQRAENTGFPSVLEFGKEVGLTSHQVAALLGWTTGDFRFVNPIARGAAEVSFEEYSSGSKALCRLTKDEVVPYVNVISSALHVLPRVLAGQRLWRGHRMPISGELGAVFTLRGFTSATYDRDEALRFAAQVTDPAAASQRTLIAIEGHCSGRSIAKFSARRGELEVLFPLDRHFQVLPRPDGVKVDEDERAVQNVVQGMRGSLPEAEVCIVYVREVDADAAWAA
eukprot:CAMPEP_0204599340 /NCGR_PEP_ID=MMETSP0661-20131031/54769_1 /ASSEMBLY_ACC=CAM_ASM_000606 /TAXON_ID=109239 /ORGANISM="Alexandrium margalefi, Strain AMGDE01CS-322" /LENGTH=257 /DNA_ID=CAMNT_0051610055 /DNA_START=127 /DNA_END=900 /DNA_ORIENTATION=-